MKNKMNNIIKIKSKHSTVYRCKLLDTIAIAA